VQRLQVVRVVEREEHAGLRATQLVGSLARILERFARDLEQQPLLRIQFGGLARRNPEVRRVEPIDVIEKAAPARVHLSRARRVRVVVARRIPPSGRDLGDRIGAVNQQPPE
jgi:hypothetical protein